MNAPSIRLFPAISAADYAQFGQMIELYETWLRERYDAVPDLIAGLRAHQNLTAELEALAVQYGPPYGVALLAAHDGQLAGAGAYRNFGGGVCEMKRVYVQEQLRGGGIGRAICEGLIAHAATGGYHAMYLDTGSLNTEALTLYERLGFRERDAYIEYPPAIAPHIRFMERALR